MKPTGEIKKKKNHLKLSNMENIAPALVKAISEIESIKKDSINPFLKNKYVSLDAIIEGTKKVLAKNNLCAFQKVSDQGIETIILHTSGESISSGMMSIPIESARGLSLAQSRGVAITYAKRYQLGAMLGISTDEDTDGHDPHRGEQIPKLSDTAWNKAVERLKSGEKDLPAKLRKAYQLTKEQEQIIKSFENGSTINNQINSADKERSAELLPAGN